MSYTPEQVAIAETALQQIKLYPEHWDQTSWRCSSGMCFAGHVTALNGFEWVLDTSNANREYSDKVYVPASWSAEQAEQVKAFPVDALIFDYEDKDGDYASISIEDMSGVVQLQDILTKSYYADPAGLARRLWKNKDRLVASADKISSYLLGLTLDDTVIYNGSNSIAVLEAGVKAMANGQSVKGEVNRVRKLEGLSSSYSVGI
jgi:hypothetical protein